MTLTLIQAGYMFNPKTNLTNLFAIEALFKKKGVKYKLY